MIRIHQKIDSVKIQSAMANNPRNSNWFLVSGREKFDVNLRSDRQICHGKQAHADIADIDAKSIHMGKLSEYLHGGVQQLAFPASPIGFEVAFENHLPTGEGSATIPVGKDYGRSVECRTVFSAEREGQGRFWRLLILCSA
jgi:hypothetical protein